MRRKLVLILITSLIMVGCGKEPVEEHVQIESKVNLIASESSIEETLTEVEQPVIDEKGSESLILNSLSDTTALRYKTIVNITTKDGTSKKENKDITNWLSEQPKETIEETLEEVVTETESVEEIVTDVELVDIETVEETTETIVEEGTTQEVEENSTVEDSEETTIETDDEVTTEETNTNWLVTTDRVNDNYVINVNYTSEVDNAAAKHYGKMNIFTIDTNINEEIAKYHNYIVEPTVEYVVKPTIVVENEVEKLEDSWYTTETEYTGLRLIRDILKSSKVVNTAENAEHYIITTEVIKNYIKALDITGLLIEDMYKGETKVPVTYYINKNTELLDRIVLTVPEELSILGGREIDACSYTIIFDKFNDINKVMIPDIVTGTAQPIEGYIKPTEAQVQQLELNRKALSDLIEDKDMTEETLEDSTEEIEELETEETETEEMETEVDSTEEMETESIDK